MVTPSPTILVTGPPRCGKTTLVQSILERWTGPAGGFVTVEMRGPHGRTGFKLVTLDGRECVLASKLSARGRRGQKPEMGPSRGPRVGSYSVNLEAMEDLAIPSVRQAVESRGLVVIDEIGKMEFKHPDFAGAVMDALDSGCPVLATIVLQPHPIADRLKALPQVELVKFAGNDGPSRRAALDAVAKSLLD